MIVTGTIIGVISFGIQVFNSWGNEKNARRIRLAQEAFQRAALAQNLEEAQALYKTMLDTKRDIMIEERQNQLDILKLQHDENLRAIEYISSLEGWPLAIHPLVMRNDNLFYDETVDMGVVPVNIVFGPSRDLNFQGIIWKQVEEELANRFSSYWSTIGSHPIIFMQDAWKNEMEQADSIMCANIRAKVMHTPTIVLSPIIMEDGLHIDVTHWCVEGMDPNVSYKKGVRLSLQDCCHNYTTGEEYETEHIPEYVNELADLIESMMGYLDDQYMWLKYGVLPQLPSILQSRIEIDDNGRDIIYKKYVEMLKSSLENGHVNIVADLKKVLAYCLLIDGFGQKHEAFDVVMKAFYGPKLLTNMRCSTPAYEPEKLMTFLTFCKNNQERIALNPAIYHDMRCGVSMVKLSNDSLVRYEKDGGCISGEEAKMAILKKEFIERIENMGARFAAKCKEACDEVIERCRKETDNETDRRTDRRNWCRPSLLEQMNEYFNDTIEQILLEIDCQSELFVESLADDSLKTIWTVQKEDEVLGIVDIGGDHMSEGDTSLILSSAQKSVRSYAKSKINHVSHDYWKENYLNEPISKRLKDYCNAFLYGWIEYRFLQEDIIYEGLSNEAIEIIKEKQSAVMEMINAVVNGYIDLLFAKQVKAQAEQHNTDCNY